MAEIDLTKDINLMCGDCLEILPTLESNSVDLIHIDPPYNTGMKKTNGKAWLCHFFDDDFTDEEYIKLITNCIKELYRILKDNRACYIFMNYKKLGLWLTNLAGGASL